MRFSTEARRFLSVLYVSFFQKKKKKKPTKTTESRIELSDWDNTPTLETSRQPFSNSFLQIRPDTKGTPHVIFYLLA